MTKKVVSESLDSVFTEFLDGLKASSRMTYRGMIAHWVNFSHMNGKESLEFRKKDADALTQKKVVAFKAYLQGLGLSDNFSRTACGAIRGFFASHRLKLEFISSEKRTIQEANRTTVDYLFSKEDLAKMSEQASLNERYVCLVGKSVGLRASDFINFTYGTFRSIHIDTEEAPIPLGEIVTGKEKVKAFPFLDSDAVQVVKAILERNPEAKNSDRILDWNEESLTQSIQSIFRKAHLESGDKTVRFHNLRKYLIDRLSAVASESQWKQIVGKKISEGAYVSTDQLRDIYLRAMPSITINGNGRNHVKIEQLEKKLAENEAIMAAMAKIFGAEILEKARTQLATSGKLRLRKDMSALEVLKTLAKLEPNNNTHET